jgi:hypothetical protein
MQAMDYEAIRKEETPSELAAVTGPRPSLGVSGRMPKNRLTGTPAETENQAFEIVPGLAASIALDAAIHLHGLLDQQ